MSHKELMNECDMLKGNINRMMVTKDPKELLRMYEFAEMRLQKIHRTRVAEFDVDYWDGVKPHAPDGFVKKYCEPYTEEKA